FFQPRRRDYALEPLTVADSPAVSVLHREDFVRPWTDGEFAALLEQDTVFGYAARETGQGSKPPAGFVLARLAAGEGEILTVAVARAHRRQGL
ncbi:GNAT family N-acetyltransferase, partial [Mesorhizobium sp. M2E.F.Ca.ET.166.01.1.1]